jgi:hypothetical protein
MESKKIGRPEFELINDLISQFKAGLSQRSINIILDILDISDQEIFKYLSKPDEIMNFRNVGRKTGMELIPFFSRIAKAFKLQELNLENDTIEKPVRKNEDYATITERLLYHFYATKPVFEYLRSIKKNDRKKLFPLFSFYQVLLNSDYFARKRNREIFLLYHGFFTEQKTTVNDIAYLHNISSERVRQIFASLVNTIQEKNKLFLEKFPGLINLSHYSNLTKDDTIHIDQGFVDTVIQNEGAHFNIRDVVFITQLITGQMFHCLDKIKFSEKKYTLINRELLDLFDFQGYFQDIIERQNEKKNKCVSINFEDHLRSFLLKNDEETLKRIKPVCSKIVMNRFEKVMVSGNDLIFEYNMHVVKNQILEVLTRQGEPMTIPEITQALITHYSYHSIKESRVRSNLVRFNEFGCMMGGDNAYYLKIWEGKKKGFKGGTIRNIVFEYLTKHQGNAHIDDIVDHVVKFRRTNKKNVIYNLKFDTDQRFVFFESGKVKLTRQAHKKRG